MTNPNWWLDEWPDPPETHPECDCPACQDWPDVERPARRRVETIRTTGDRL